MRLRYRVDGAEEAPVVVLGSSLGTTSELWAAQMPALMQEWRVVRFELPGHGGAPVPDGPFGVADLADGVAGVLDELGASKAAYAGVSLGGAVGQMLALRAPERVASLVLCCTSARFGDPGPWQERAERVRRDGMAPVADGAAGRWFTPGFGGAEPYLAMLRSTDPAGYAACCEALAAFDTTGRLAEITAPTLVIAGRDDVPTPPRGHGDRLAEGIPDARLAVVEGGHLANAERPGLVTDEITAHLRRTWKGGAA